MVLHKRYHVWLQDGGYTVGLFSAAGICTRGVLGSVVILPHIVTCPYPWLELSCTHWFSNLSCLPPKSESFYRLKTLRLKLAALKTAKTWKISYCR
ncbi:hypothetical protein PoB_007499500 [Plakobranchus ocellatus]|uniref:Uncharacterized protein n=1 Tax=Plakobranchus ocellatus TaxID=259542 RepID=A0AAV4DWF3_9GAST|nr:hypothetical protein PoB_007499500 [Plakobranchus ocellatus]